MLPHLTNSSLLSIGQLCDNNCVAIFDKYAVNIYQQAKRILTGTRNLNDGLWDIHLPSTTKNIISSPSTLSLNTIIHKNMPKSQLAAYLHACAFSPTLDTFQKAINNSQFLTWPAIDKINIKKFLTDQTATHMGHLDQERSHLQSTKLPKDIRHDFFPTTSTPSPKQYSVCSKIVPFSPKELSYGDLTGSFPYTSSRGNKYLYVMYDYDSNAILLHPLKTRQASEITSAWQTLHTKLTQHGHKIKNFILDNEFSHDLRQALTKNKINFQLVPPNVHRRNAAERAIRTFKAHFLAGLATCDPDFPITEWDRLLPQAEMTLNMLRTSRCHPKLSAYAYIWGNHDFNKTPLAPPGTRVVIHKKPGVRNTWGFHGERGWYIGPAPNHYRCFTCYVPATAKEVITDTVRFIPKKVIFPHLDINRHLQLAIEKIIFLLETNYQQVNTKLTHHYEILQAFKHIAKIVNQSSTQTHTPILPRVPTHMQHMLSTLRPQRKPNFPRVQLPRVHTSLPHTNTNFTSPVHHFLHTRHRPYTNQQMYAPPHFQPRPTPNAQQCQPSTFHRPVQAFLHRTPAHFSTGPPPNAINHIYDVNGKKLPLDKLLMQASTKDIWTKALNNELGRLANGYKKIIGTQTLKFIPKRDIPPNRKITYSNFVCDIRPHKKELYRVRMTVGGDKLEYTNDTASPAATLLDTKVILNSTISDHKKYGSKFCTVDIKDFFLQTMLDIPEYIRIHKKYFTQDFIQAYDMHHIPDNDGYVYCEINKGMYGLKQAAILAYNQLVARLEQYGYHPLRSSTGLWKHKTKRTMFALCVDDFGIKYDNKDDLNHLLHALKMFYDITIDMTGSSFCGLTLHWDYNNQFVDVSMPGYVEKKLQKFQHPMPNKPQYAPHPWIKPSYGQKLQYAPPPDDSDKLDKKGTTRVQSITGSFLYYARAVDPTILTALNEIATQQAAPTLETNKKVKMLMDYLATYPNAKLRFYAGSMILCVESDAAYLVLPNARSRVAGHFYLEAPSTPSKAYSGRSNAPILTECYTLRNVVSSAAEAECAGIFHNCIVATGIRNTLKEMGHPQPPTPIITDNTTAHGFVHSAMRAKRSKSWDMKYNWLRDRETKNQFAIKWKTGKTNMADYFTKHHSPNVHRAERKNYVLKGFLIQNNQKQEPIRKINKICPQYKRARVY